jgi:hypothetical protein
MNKSAIARVKEIAWNTVARWLGRARGGNPRVLLPAQPGALQAHAAAAESRGSMTGLELRH